MNTKMRAPLIRCLNILGYAPHNKAKLRNCREQFVQFISKNCCVIAGGDRDKRHKLWKAGKKKKHEKYFA